MSPTTGDLVHYFDRSMENPGPHEATIASAHEDPSVLSLTITAPGRVVQSDKLGSYHYEAMVPHAPGRDGRYWQTPEETAELSAQAEARGEANDEES
jgi:hypothetical protein